MPSTTKPPAHLMAACAHGAAYKKCPPLKVAREFNRADKRAGLLRRGVKGGSTTPLESGMDMKMNFGMGHGQNFFSTTPMMGHALGTALGGSTKKRRFAEGGAVKPAGPSAKERREIREAIERGKGDAVTTLRELREQLTNSMPPEPPDIARSLDALRERVTMQDGGEVRAEETEQLDDPAVLYQEYLDLMERLADPQLDSETQMRAVDQLSEIESKLEALGLDVEEGVSAESPTEEGEAQQMADGGAVSDRSEEERSPLADLYEQYPGLKRYDIQIKDSRAGGADWRGQPYAGRKMEFYPPGEAYNPNPKKPTIEVFSDDVGAKDALGEVFSHLLPRIDPQFGDARAKFVASIDPKQKEMLRGDYQSQIRSGVFGNRRPTFDEWLNGSGGDAFFRGYVADQYPKHFYRSDQIEMFSPLMQRLTASDADEAAQLQPVHVSVKKKITMADGGEASMRPIERESLLQKILGGYGDVLGWAGKKARQLGTGMRPVTGPEMLMQDALTSGGRSLADSGKAFEDWSQGFSPVDMTESIAEPVVNREQLANVIGGLPPVAEVSRAVPGALRHAAQDFVAAQAGAVPRITAYHGSPHEFDTFDVEKIGTGQGAHSFGHGLYFAEEPKVAQNYRKQLSKGEPGYLYTVDIPDEHVARMIDWDKSLAEQPANVKEALSQIPDDFKYDIDEILEANGYNPIEWDDLHNEYDFTGGQMVKALDHVAGNVDAAQMLQDLGVPGVRYFDGRSRPTGEGTRNFVVFDDTIPKILKRE